MNSPIFKSTIAAVTFGLAAWGAAQVAGPAGGAPKIGTPAQRNEAARIAGPMQRYQEAMKQIDIAPDQKKRIMPLWKKLADEMKAIRQEALANKIDRKDANAKIKTATDAFREGLKDVLTPDQQTKLAELLKETPRPGAKKNDKKPV